MMTLAGCVEVVVVQDVDRVVAVVLEDEEVVGVALVVVASIELVVKMELVEVVLLLVI